MNYDPTHNDDVLTEALLVDAEPGMTVVLAHPGDRRGRAWVELRLRYGQPGASASPWGSEYDALTQWTSPLDGSVLTQTEWNVAHGV